MLDLSYARKMLFGALLFLPVLASADEVHPWLPVDSKDLQMKEFKPLPGAEAVLLYYANEIDDVGHYNFFYSRVKIFSDGGKQYANVEIPTPEKATLTDFFARTIHPDGKIVELTDRPFEKVVLRAKGLQVRVQAVTLPEVSAGDVIEYKYEIHYGDKGAPRHAWTVQHDLYAVKEHFSFKYDKKFSVRWLPTPGLKQSPDHDQKAAVLKMDAENVPPFEAEERMPPEDGYKLQVKFFYISPYMSSPSSYWFQNGQYLARGLEAHIGNHKEFVDAAREAIGSETDPEKKLRKLYARAQEIRNLSYERERTHNEQKKEELKENKTSLDILRHGYADRYEVVSFFVALARGAGFTASTALVASRESSFFDREVMSFRQFNSEIAVVRLNGKFIYLDPGTRFCPYGLLRWTHTGTAAMDMADPGNIFNTPGASEDSAFMARSAELKLSSDGGAQGEVRVEFSGTDALEWRLWSLSTDEAGRKKALEEEMKLWLPANAKAEMTDSVGWDKEYEPLTAVFKVEVPEYASAAGKRLLIPTALFLPKNKQVLKSGPRKYPIYYRYAFSEVDHVSLEMPEGYSPETLAAPQMETTKVGKYSNDASVTGKYVNLERSLKIVGILFTPDRYDEVRNFFSKVDADDELQTILHQAPAANAQKAN
jgi:hypothetical protein